MKSLRRRRSIVNDYGDSGGLKVKEIPNVTFSYVTPASCLDLPLTGVFVLSSMRSESGPFDAFAQGKASPSTQQSPCRTLWWQGRKNTKARAACQLLGRK